MMDQQYPATMNQNLPALINFSDEEIMEQYNRALMVPLEADEQPMPIYDIIDGTDIEYGLEEEKEESEENAYGLEGEYKKDFEEWKHNYNWFGKSFQEWIQEKQEYQRELIREMEENWEDDMSDDGGKYDR